MFDNIMFDEEILFTYIGYAAGLATILTFAIQILRIIETKNVTNLSSYMYIIYSLGLVCWFAYGVYIDSYILLFSNLITFFCTFIILILIIYYDAEDKIEESAGTTSQRFTTANILSRPFLKKLRRLWSPNRILPLSC